MYRQAMEDHGLSLEQGTAAVPDDGHYYVLFKGQTIGRARSLKKARAIYEGARKSLDLGPLPGANASAKASVDELRRREMESMSNKALIWTEEDLARVERKTRGKKGTRSAG